MSQVKEKCIGSLLVPLFFVLAGLVTLYDTRSYTDVDSKVFPQAVAIILIVTAGIACVQWLLSGHSGDEGFAEGIWWRRILIVLSLLGTCSLIPVIGFLGASVVAFGAGLVAAMHDRWSPRSLIIYCGSGLITVVAFYALFKFVLHVPLP